MPDSTIRTEAFQADILHAVEADKEIVFVLYSILDDTEEKIKYALAQILDRRARADLFTPLYSCTKELIANAVKANAKRLLIDEGVITDPDDPIEVVKMIRSVLNEKSLLEYGIKAKEHRLSTRVYFKAEPERFVIEVINNVPLDGKDLKRILERIEKSSKYDSIAEFYMENPDPIAEGMGLGLSMVVVLIKSIDIDWRNFTVSTNGKDKTYARITVPLA